MFRPILVPHGITDLVDYPFKSIILYGTLTPIIAKLPWETKAGILLVASVYHLRNDVPGGLCLNVFMHAAWVYNPLFAKFYLTFVHVPRHYSRTLKTRPVSKIVCVLFMTLVTVADTFMKWSVSFPDLWWVGPVVAHVLLEPLHEGVERAHKRNCSHAQ